MSYRLGRIMRIETTGCGVFSGAGIVRSAARDESRSGATLVTSGPLCGRPGSPRRWLECCNGRGRVRRPQAKKNVGGVVCFIATKLRRISHRGVLARLRLNYGSRRLKAVWGAGDEQSSSRRQTIGVSHVCGQFSMVHQRYEPLPWPLGRSWDSFQRRHLGIAAISAGARRASREGHWPRLAAGVS